MVQKRQWSENRTGEDPSLWFPLFLNVTIMWDIVPRSEFSQYKHKVSETGSVSTVKCKRGNVFHSAASVETVGVQRSRVG
jgi:hypothetical protein